MNVDIASEKIIQRRRLVEVLSEHFSLVELRVLVFQLLGNDIADTNKSQAIIDLVGYYERRNQYEILISAIEKARPAIHVRIGIYQRESQNQSYEKGNRTALADLEKSKPSLGEVKLGEVKLIILGEGEVGKTSLVKRLLNDPKYPYLRREPLTNGIKVWQWFVNARTEQVRVNIWDFGGQEIQQPVHKFFLTKCSIYLVVLNARRDEHSNRLEYWLKLAQNFGNDENFLINSPIIVVINHSDIQDLNLNEQLLREKYKNIKFFIKTSCEKNLGINTLRNNIIQCIEGMNNVFRLISENWLTLKQQLEYMQENFNKPYLSYQEYTELCAKKGVNCEDSKRLLDILKYTGTIHNYSEYDQSWTFQDTNILNPEWLTEGIYSIITSELIASTNGVFKHTDLNQLLDSQKYPTDKEREFIINMMMINKFELCFKQEQQKKYFVPTLFKKNQIATQIPKTDDQDTVLAFQYQYDVLPYSIISKLIIRMHELIPDKQYWRTGAIFHHQNNDALVIADMEEANISIWIDGHLHTRREFLAVIRFHLEHIHQEPFMSNLTIKSLVPYKGALISYEHILGLEMQGVLTNYYEGIDEPVEIAKLLNSIGRIDLKELQRKNSSINIEKLIISGGKTNIADNIHYQEKAQQ